MPPLLAWFLYGNLIGLTTAGVAWGLERLFSRMGLPVRWVWLGGMALTGAVPVVQLGRAGPVVSLPLLGEADRYLGHALRDVTGTGLVPAADGGLTLAADPTATLLAGWAAASGLAVLWLGWSVWCLRRRRSGWSARSRADGSYYLTADLGPGVVGVLRQRILLPRWVLALDEDEQEMVWSHEREHVRAGDNRFLAAGLITVLLMPWVAPLWWQFRRLRGAVELDCDRRVLARMRNDEHRRRYGRLLLKVAGGSHLLPAAPFSRRNGVLERRIVQIAPGTDPDGGWLPAGIRGLAAGALLVCALAVPAPGVGTGWSLLPLGSPRELMSTFRPAPTGYDQGPVPTNPDEVLAALRAGYPETLRRKGIGGRVGLALHLDEEGRVIQARLADPSPYPALNEAAREAARVRRHRPARRDGEPVAVWVFWAAEFPPEG